MLTRSVLGRPTCGAQEDGGVTAPGSDAPWLGLLGLLGVWNLIQALPLPVRLLGWIQPGARPAYDTLFGGSGFTTLAMDRFAMWSQATQWIAIGMLAWVCARLVRTRRAVYALSTGLVVAGTSQVLIGLFLRGSQHDPAAWSATRMTGSFPGGNTLGSFLAMTLPVTCGMLLALTPRLVESLRGRNPRIVVSEMLYRRQTLSVLALAVAAAMQATGLLLSGSRGAVACAAVAIVTLLAWFAARTAGRSRTIVLRVCLAAVGIVVFIGTGGTFLGLATRFRDLPSQAAESTLPRWTIWKNALHLFTDHPLGVGLGAFSHAFTRYQPPGFESTRVYHAHCDYLEWLCELGWPALLVIPGALLLFFRRTATLATDHPKGYSIWLWRGAWTGVIAALLHAATDFNLSSRPAVAVLFAVLAGLTLGYSPRLTTRQTTSARTIYAVPPPQQHPHVAPAETHRREGKRRPATHEPPHENTTVNGRTPQREPPAETRPPGTALVARQTLLWFVLCGLIAVWHGARLRASLHLERGYTSLGGRPDMYFWLPTPDLPADAAQEALDRARQLAPGWAWAHYVSGLGRTLAFQQRREQALEQGRGRWPDMDQNELKRLVRLGMKLDEIDTARKAADDLVTAAALVPWHADTRAALSAALFTQASGSPPADAERLSLAAGTEARRAIWLAPNDAFTLTETCKALSLGTRLTANRGRKDDRELLKEVGLQALRLRGSRENAVIRAWHAAGIPVLDILPAADLPLDFLWKTYRFYDRLPAPDAALKCARALYRQCAAPVDSASRVRTEKRRRAAEQLRTAAVKEIAKWLLRLGRWEAYRQFLADRESAHTWIIDREVNPVADVDPSGDLLYVKLKNLAQHRGLDATRGLQLSRLEELQGHALSASRRAAEWALQEQPPIQALESHLGAQPKEAPSEQSLGQSLARARCLMHRSSFTSAEDLFASALHSHDLDQAFRHRVLRFLASCAVQNRQEDAHTLFRRAVSLCPTDVSTLRQAMESIGRDWTLEGPDRADTTPSALARRLTPDVAMDVRFLGGAVRLDGVALTGEQDQYTDPLSLTLYWSFWARSPVDLQVLVRTADKDGFRTSSQAKAFVQTDPLGFAAGRPPIGHVSAMTFTVPPRARLSPRLAVTLRRKQDATPLPSGEGLKTLGFWTWSDLAHAQPRAAAQNNSEEASPALP